MAKRRKSLLSNKYLMWGLYGVAAYYAYGWWMSQSQDNAQPVIAPSPQVSAFPPY